MLCKDITTVIETTYPKHAAIEWDNVGLLAGRSEKEVKRIYVALDVTDEIIEDAICKGADMLITHHPFVFSPLKQVTDEALVTRRMLKLIQHDIAYYSMHTNYDVLRMAELATEKLGLTDLEVLEVTKVSENQGFGKVGNWSSPVSVEDCCKKIKEVFGLEMVKVFGSLEHTVQRIAISPGSGKHMSEFAISKCADVFITAEIDHHEGLDAVAEGLAVIDAGHYGLEHIFIEDMANFLTDNIQNVDVVWAKVSHPFQFV